GPRGDEVEPAARAEQAGAEAGHDIPALVLEGHRRHRDENVVGQQATSTSTSADSHARGNFATVAPSAGGPAEGGGWSAWGWRRCRLARARLSALLTDSTVEPSMPATSLAWKPRTSRKMRTATWRGGRTCRAVTKAREMASACS